MEKAGEGKREREKKGRRMDGWTDGCHKHPPKVSTYLKLWFQHIAEVQHILELSLNLFQPKNKSDELSKSGSYPYLQEESILKSGKDNKKKILILLSKYSIVVLFFHNYIFELPIS